MTQPSASQPSVSQPSVSQPSTSRPPAIGDVGSPCRVALPAAWRRAIASSTLWHGATLPSISGIPAPGYDGVLVGRRDGTATRLDVLGARGHPLGSLGTIHGAPGMGLAADSATGSHLAVVYQSTAGESAQNSWTLYMWSRASGLRRVAKNPTDRSGQPLPGGYVHPFFAGDRYLYWIQAATAGQHHLAGSSLLQYDLTSGRTRTMFTGLVTAAVPYGNEVLLAGTPADAIDTVGNNRLNTSIHAIDQVSGRPIDAPDGLDLGHDGPLEMVTNGDLVAWDTNDAGIRAWRPEWAATRTVFPDYQHVPRDLADISHPDNLGISGQFLVWNGPRDWVMDLHTDSVAPLSDRAGQVDLSGHRLMFWQDTSRRLAAGPNGPFTYSAALLDLDTVPDLPGCH